MEWYCREDLLEDLQGDLHESFHRRCNKGHRWPGLIYSIDVVKFVRAYTIKPIKPPGMQISNLLGNNLKTSYRYIRKDRLFSGINVFGLAISMSVGLFVINLISEIRSYDNFHQNKSEIYRVISRYDYGDGRIFDLGTSSPYMSQALDDYHDLYKHKALLNDRFSGLANTGERQLPIDGLYATPEFLNIFSFPLLSGNDISVLDEPYSIILTEEMSHRLFSGEDPVGASIDIDEKTYTVKGIIENPPYNSHIQFNSLISFGTYEIEQQDDEQFTAPSNVFRNYIYLQIDDPKNVERVEDAISSINRVGDEILEDRSIRSELQPLKDIFTGEELSNQIGNHMPSYILFILAGLALLVILVACFNYTNLSLARSLRRTKEIGVRKVTGASRANLFFQFSVESILIALIALVVALPFYYVVRKQMLEVQQGDPVVELNLTIPVIIYFVLFSLVIGFVAGLLPSAALSKLNITRILKFDQAPKIWSAISLRKIFVFIQFSFSLIFILITIFAWKQYRHLLNFDLGFSTDRIVNVDLQRQEADILAQELSYLPDITHISKAQYQPNTGRMHVTYARFNSTMDSSRVHINSVDENYLPLHEHKFIAGRNFLKYSERSDDVIVNETLLKHFQLGAPNESLGSLLTVDGEDRKIVGVVQDFHHSNLGEPIEPYVFSYDPALFGLLNLKVSSDDMVETMASIDRVWKKLDPIYPLQASFYDEQISQNYEMLTILIKCIGFVAFLTIIVAGLGLLGMSVYNVQTRIKEIGVRKVLGATPFQIVRKLTGSYMIIVLSAIIASTLITYFIINNVVLTDLPDYAPMGAVEILLSVGIVLIVSSLILGLQSYRASQINPAVTLKSE